MNKILLLSLIATISGCASTKVDHFIATNLQQGLIAFGKQDEPVIYQTGTQFPYIVNGTCVADGKREKCMWHGYEFDYESPERNAQIICVGKSNHTQTQLTPDKILAEDTDIVRWQFVLPGYKGHYIRPQYYISKANHLPFRTISKCYYKSQEIFQLEFTATGKTH